MLLIRCLIIGIAGREHHALNAQIHHLVEERPDAFRIGPVEQGCVGRDPKTSLQSFLDPFDRQFVTAFPAHRKVVMLLLAVHMDRKREVLAGLELVDFML